MLVIFNQSINLRELDENHCKILKLSPEARIVQTKMYGFDDDTVKFWYEFSIDIEDYKHSNFNLEDRKLYAFGTGTPIPDDLTYVATAVGAVFVWHLYEQTRR